MENRLCRDTRQGARAEQCATSATAAHRELDELMERPRERGEAASANGVRVRRVGELAPADDLFFSPFADGPLIRLWPFPARPRPGGFGRGGINAACVVIL